MSLVCDKCNALFDNNTQLKRHINKKIPCKIDVDVDSDKICCEHCGRQFTAKSSLKRHIDSRCLVLKNKQRPMAAIDFHDLRELVIDQKETIENIQKQLVAICPTTTNNSSVMKRKSHDINSVNNGVVNTNSTINTNNNITNITYIRPWSPPDVLNLTYDMLVKEVNKQFMIDCAILSAEKRADDKIAAHHIVRAFSTLVIRTHEDPSDRNICSDADRVDQARVFDNDWTKKVYSFDAIRIIFDNIARDLSFLLSTGQIDHFTPNMINTIKWMIVKYYQNRDEYARLSKAHLYPHFSNNTPPKDQIASNKLITNDDTVHQQKINPWRHLTVIHFSTGFIRTKFRTCDQFSDYDSIYEYGVINMKSAVKMIEKIILTIIKIMHEIETNRNIKINQTCEIFAYKEHTGWTQISQEEAINELSDSVIENFRRVMESDEMRIIDAYVCRFITDIIGIYDKNKLTIIRNIAGPLIDHLDDMNRGLITP
jgi:uncharacterized C2H2 Zn-finger protein